MSPLCSAGSHAEYWGRNPCLAEGSLNFEDSALRLHTMPAPTFLWMYIYRQWISHEKERHAFRNGHTQAAVWGYMVLFSEELNSQASWNLALQVLGSAERCNMANSFSIFPDWYHRQGLWAFFSGFPFISSITGNKKKSRFPLSYFIEQILILVKSSFLLLLKPAPRWLQQKETCSFYAKRVQRSVLQ